MYKRKFVYFQRQGFTLLEMLVVLALLSLFLSLGAVKLDLGNQQARAEYQQFFNLLRQHHVQAIKNGKERHVKINPLDAAVGVTSSTGEQLQNFEFKYWSVNNPKRKFQLILTPTGVYGPEYIELKNGEVKRLLELDMLNTVRESR